MLGRRGSTLQQHGAATALPLAPMPCSVVHTPHHHPCVAARPSSSARGVACCATLKRDRRSGVLQPHRRSDGSDSVEPDQPSTSSPAFHSDGLADWGTRFTLNRLYYGAGQSSGSSYLDHLSLQGPFLVTVDDRPQRTRNQERCADYFANVGDAIRCLREDIPMLFQRELDYSIYRDDIVFRDPRNCFKGMKNYQLIFWSLRFHGKIFFKTLYVDVKRIWQPEDTVIKMRWTVHGIPRVPWEAEGTFDGISTYKLDSAGRIYEHSVDNILLRDPPMATNPPLLAGLNLVPSQQPAPGIFWKGAGVADYQPWVLSAQQRRISWVRFYMAMVATMELVQLQPAAVLAAVFV